MTRKDEQRNHGDKLCFVKLVFLFFNRDQLADQVIARLLTLLGDKPCGVFAESPHMFIDPGFPPS
ncbi:hypothetical protein D3C77_611820 [compost metagenome]